MYCFFCVGICLNIFQKYSRKKTFPIIFNMKIRISCFVLSAKNLDCIYNLQSRDAIRHKKCFWRLAQFISHMSNIING